MSARIVLVVAAAVVVAVGIGAGCSEDGSSAPPSPEPARSVATMPPGTDKDGDPTDAGLRTVTVFIKDGLTRAEREAMAAEIAAMPEVELYHFDSKREALRRFKRQYGDRITVDWSSNPLPASFEILVRKRERVRPVAEVFLDDPRVSHTPDTRDGVQFIEDW